MECSVCRDEVPEYGGILLTIDGDFACSEKCEIKYKKDKEHFFNVIVHDEEKCKNWLMGE